MNAHATLTQTLNGQHYNDVRESIFAIDWDGLYPEVDTSGRLTGNVINAAERDYEIVDVGNGVVTTGGQASDAMILADLLND